MVAPGTLLVDDVVVAVARRRLGGAAARTRRWKGARNAHLFIGVKAHRPRPKTSLLLELSPLALNAASELVQPALYRGHWRVDIHHVRTTRDVFAVVVVITLGRLTTTSLAAATLALTGELLEVKLKGVGRGDSGGGLRSHCDG